MPTRRFLPVVLAAGSASRLDGIAKCLLPLDGKTLLDRCAEALVDAGHERLLVVTGHRSQEIVDYMKRAPHPLETVFVHNELYRDLNNFHSLRVAIDGADDDSDLLILNCDIIFMPHLVRLAALVAAPLGLLVERRVVDDEAMKTCVDAGRVTRLGKEIARESAFGEFIGISTMMPAAQELYLKLAETARAAGEGTLYYEDIYDRMCDHIEARVCAVEPETWAEVDCPSDIPAAIAVARKTSVASFDSAQTAIPAWAR